MGHRGNWQVEGYTLKLEDSGDGFFRVLSFSKSGDLVGVATFKFASDLQDWTITPNLHNLEVCTVEVKEDHQRKGLASAMYDLIENHTNAKILNGIGTIHQTEDAKRFWQKRIR
jgi:ribosomal protein S18 acetylase RimI-like enzyme